MVLFALFGIALAAFGIAALTGGTDAPNKTQ